MWKVILSLASLLLRIVQIIQGRQKHSEYRKDIDKIKDDPVDAFDRMFGGGVRDGRPDEGADADKAGETGTDPSAKS